VEYKDFIFSLSVIINFSLHPNLYSTSCMGDDKINIDNVNRGLLIKFILDVSVVVFYFVVVDCCWLKLQCTKQKQKHTVNFHIR